MAAYRLPDGKYRVQVDLGRKFDGSRDRATQVCKTEAEANKIEREFKKRKLVNNGISGRTPLYIYAEQVWLPAKEAFCRHDTYRIYKSVYTNHIKPLLGKICLTDIKQSQVQSMIMKCDSEKTGRNARDTLRNILSMAMGDDLLLKNVAAYRKYHYPRKIEKQDSEGFGEWLTSFNQHTALINLARGTSAFPLIVVGLCFGLRKGEILGLDWEQVDFKNREIHVIQTYVRGGGGPKLEPPKTPGSVRTIPMTEYAYKLLKEIQNLGGIAVITGPVCRSIHGNRFSPSTSYDCIRRFTDNHPEAPRITLLTLRHSFATSAIRSGANLVSVSKWLGHTSITTTLNRYVKPLSTDLRTDVVNVLDAQYEITA